jgi:uncharacterized protein (TIGR02145 family)
LLVNNTFSIHLKNYTPTQMKRIITLIFGIIFSFTALAQSPQKFSYQTVVRSSSGQLLTNQTIAVKISILQGSENGTIVYAERHTPTTNSNGLASFQIGGGMTLNGSMASINWAQGPYFTSTETDPNGGSNYSIASTQQLLSVPYALYAETVGTISPGPQGPAGLQGPIGLTGPQGPVGLIGPQGETGATGTQGSIGLTGPQGPVGQTGATGQTGPQGQAGQTGAPGSQGPAGTNGQNTLVKTTTEVAGNNCPTGGVKLEYGLDANISGSLDAGEINAALTKYVCNGAVGAQGPVGNGLGEGTEAGQMNYWDGSNWTQVETGNQNQLLTFCNGVPTWTNNGQCPGSISTLNCSSAINTGLLTQGIAASNASISVPYLGGNGGTYDGQAVQSNNVSGLTATLTSGSFANGAGNLTFTITGTPSVSGTANFAITIGGVNCTLTLTVISNNGISSQASCGASNVHNPTKTYGTVTDQQGNVYKTIVIGTQEWMAENLKSTIYQNGDLIPNLIDNAEWSNLSTGAWCYYNNDSLFNCPYGKLYNWYAASDPRNVCPVGWHVPNDNDWPVLFNYLGGLGIAGGKMKTTGSQYWQGVGGTINAASNESGFSALPAGARGLSVIPGNQTFTNLSSTTQFWSSTDTPSLGKNQNLGILETGPGPGISNKMTGYSLRCIKD